MKVLQGKENIIKFVLTTSLSQCLQSLDESEDVSTGSQKGGIKNDCESSCLL